MVKKNKLKKSEPPARESPPPAAPPSPGPEPIRSYGSAPGSPAIPVASNESLSVLETDIQSSRNVTVIGKHPFIANRTASKLNAIPSAAPVSNSYRQTTFILPHDVCLRGLNRVPRLQALLRIHFRLNQASRRPTSVARTLTAQAHLVVTQALTAAAAGTALLERLGRRKKR
jgi:hypothetical protein